ETATSGRKLGPPRLKFYPVGPRKTTAKTHAGEPVDNSDQIGKVRTAPAVLVTFGPAKIPPPTPTRRQPALEAPAMPFPRASKALARFTVLDLTRVRSGPTCVR